MRDFVHSSRIKVLTDLSRSKGGVVFAVITGENSLCTQLPTQSSVFTSEIYATLSTIVLITLLSGSIFTVYTDFYCDLFAPAQYASAHPVVQPGHYLEKTRAGTRPATLQQQQLWSKK